MLNNGQILWEFPSHKIGLSLFIWNFIHVEMGTDKSSSNSKWMMYISSMIYPSRFEPLFEGISFMSQMTYGMDHHDKYLQPYFLLDIIPARVVKIEVRGQKV